ncbi:MAG: ribonucleoside triphosphate reductase [Kiritimatiellae bacterium]|nr:ribonucleoside triphosphate reductase [Kiritimatiellia bacterium]
MPSIQDRPVRDHSVPATSFTADLPHHILEFMIKRDGRTVAFDPLRIESAVLRAGQATQEFGQAEAKLLTAQVIKVLEFRFPDALPHVEDIQDIVEQTLITANHFKTARAYIIYRENRARLRGDRRTRVDSILTVNEYLQQADWRVNANANQGYSLGGLILNVAGKVVANYWLSHVYPRAIGEAHRAGDFHIHDLDMLSGYCAGWSLRTFLREGINGVPGKVDAAPPRHLSSAVGQVVNFLGTLQNEWAGAQALSSFDTYLAPFVRKDHLSYEGVRQAIQEFIFNLNVPSRWGTQTPFTNLTFDMTCPADLRAEHPHIGGEEMPFTYGELQDEMDMINRAYIETMSTGDDKARIFTFPIPTYNVTPDFKWDGPLADALFDLTAKYGLPYFQNFLNSDLDPGMVRSMCCRLQLDLTQLLKRGNGLFGSAEQTGSIGVVTINCARLGYVHKGDKAALFARLDHLLDLAKSSLEIKRKEVQRLIDHGLLPYTKRYLGTLRNHFSTIGVNGINEMIRNFTDDAETIASESGKALAIEFLSHIREQLVNFQEETGNLYNLEATPAEGTTYRLAKEDQKRYPDIRQAGTPEAPYYTNSSQLPVGYTDDPFEALVLQEDMQRQYTGGTVFHLYLGERIESAQACKNLVRRTLERFRVPYLTITPVFSICERHGYLNGEQQKCPNCGASCEVWTRVMGYHRPVSEFNIGKKREHADRKWFVADKALP